MNGKNPVAEKIRKIIEECAKEMGYVANYSAKKLREGKSYTIVLIIDDLRSYIFSTIADEIIVYAAENKYAVSVFITNGDDTKERNAMTNAVGRGVDGIIIAPVQSSGENFAYLKKCGVAYVLLGRVYDEFGDDLSVAYDEIRIGYLTTENLLCNGHSDIAVFNGEEHIYASKRRLEGIRSAFYSYGKEFKEQNIYNLPINIHSNHRILREAVSKAAENCTTIICYDDNIALEAASCLDETGRSVTEDISLTGFGNIQKNMFFMPDLTRVRIVSKCNE